MYDLPIDCPYPIEELIPYILKDKKIKQNHLHLVVVTQLGEATIQPILVSQLQKYLEELL